MELSPNSQKSQPSHSHLERHLDLSGPLTYFQRIFFPLTTYWNCTASATIEGDWNTNTILKYSPDAAYVSKICNQMNNTLHNNDTIHSLKLIHMQDQKMPGHNCSTLLNKAKPILYPIKWNINSQLKGLHLLWWINNNNHTSYSIRFKIVIWKVCQSFTSKRKAPNTFCVIFDLEIWFKQTKKVQWLPLSFLMGLLWQ